MTLLSRFLHWLPCFGFSTVPEVPLHPGDLYLLRKYLLPQRTEQRNWYPGTFLHWFNQSDSARQVHNHPWHWSFSVCLSGGYIEHRYNRSTKQWTKRTIRPGSINVIRADDFHRVDLLDPERGCWTFFVAGPHKDAAKGNEWGFLDPETDVFTGQATYLKGQRGLEFD